MIELRSNSRSRHERDARARVESGLSEHAGKMRSDNRTRHRIDTEDRTSFERERERDRRKERKENQVAARMRGGSSSSSSSNDSTLSRRHPDYNKQGGGLVLKPRKVVE